MKFDKLISQLGEQPRQELVTDPARDLKEATLDAIRQIESSGGKNTEHHMVDHGLNEGDTAIGDFGLMPKTISDVARHHPVLKEKYGENIIEHIEHDPHAQRDVASHMYDDIATKLGNEPEVVGTAWNAGLSAARKRKDLYERGIGKPLSATDYNKKLLNLLK